MRCPSLQRVIINRDGPKNRQYAGLRSTDETSRLPPADLSRIYKDSPISIWVEDFSSIKERLETLKRNGTRDIRAYFKKHPEEVIALAQKVRVLDVNKATLETYEAATHRELLRGLGLVFNKESYDVFKEEIVALAEGKTVFSSEAVTKSLRGNLRHILLKLVVPHAYAGTLSRVFIFIIDITELKESHKDLRESEAKYKTVVELAPNALLMIDADTGIVLEANRRAERLFGLPTEQIVGMHLEQLLPREESERHRKIIQDHVEDGCRTSSEIVVCGKSGNRASVSVRSCLVGIQGRRCVLMIFQEMDEGQEEAREPGALRSAAWNHPARHKELERLSRREQDVIRLVSAGMTNRQIAKKLFISVKTVETHRARIMDKLGFHKTADIVRFAIYSGLFEEMPEKG